MKHSLLYILFIGLLLLPLRSVATNTSANDSIRISLLTCAPGQEIYSLFGHTAIRYEEPAKGIDVVFNYGVFSFKVPNFALRFALGETDYQLGLCDFKRFAYEYTYFDRSVWQQTLHLTQTEKKKLINLLKRNYEPQNRIYRYNFFYDNCATRPRDIISKCLEGTLTYPSTPADASRTFREIVHEHCRNHPWSRFGIDLCIGSEADQPITRQQMMFAPFYLKDFFEGATVQRGDTVSQLVASEEIILDLTPEEEESFGWPTPLQSSLLLFILTASLTIYGIRKQKGLWGFDCFLFGAAGIAGSILAFLALFSQHPAVGSNYLLCVFHPGQLLFLPYVVYCIRKKKTCVYLTANLIVLTLFILFSALIPQRIDFAVVPLALCLLVRSASNLILTYKK